MMAGSIAVVTIAMTLSILVTGALVVIAVVIRREDRRNTLIGEAPDRISRSVRRLTGRARRDLGSELLRTARQLVH
jgi:hypothetical protein